MGNSNKICAKCYLPSEGKMHEFQPRDLEVFTDIDDYWGKREGLVFFPFDRKSTAYFFSLDEANSVATEFQIASNDLLSKEEYETSVMLAQLAMKEGDLNKVVLARNEIIEGPYNAEKSFENAIEKYSDSYCYYVNLGYECWVGASPELLMHYENGTVYTVALAGTKLLDESFTDKEIEEQSMVEQFVEEKFIKIGINNFHKSEKLEAQFNQIKHLKTSYTAQCSFEDALNLLKHLQPTSAVCGLPRDKSFAFISDYETLNRSFYSGITGVLKKNRASFFVNLRCMRFAEGKVELFAGAGITEDSIASDEWLETERKLDAIRRLL